MPSRTRGHVLGDGALSVLDQLAVDRVGDPSLEAPDRLEGLWGWVVDADTFGLGGDPSTTNQRMEIRAALEAARALPRPLTVCSDSKYVVDCFDKAWWRKWRANGWRTSQKQPVANRDLWEPLVEVASTDVTFRWVKGHSGVNRNEVADRLANAGMLGEAFTAPLDLVATAAAAIRSERRFVVAATWSARCKACGDRYTDGTSVTKNELGWVHAECAAT